MPANGKTWGITVSETRSHAQVLHHRNGDLSPVQANTTTAVRAGLPQASSSSAARPHDYPSVWVGSETKIMGKGTELQPRSRLPHPHRGLHHLAGMATASLPPSWTELKVLGTMGQILNSLSARQIGLDPMPRALGIWVSVRVSWFWLRWVAPGFGHAEGRRVVPGDGRFHGPAGW